MDLLSISLDLDVDSSSSTNTPASNSLQRIRTPSISKRNELLKTQKRPSAKSSPAQTPVNKNAPENTPESSKRARSQNIRRYSPSPDALASKKRFSNIIINDIKEVRTLSTSDIGSLFQNYGGREVTDYNYIPSGKISQKAEEYQKRNPYCKNDVTQFSTPQSSAQSQLKTEKRRRIANTRFPALKLTSPLTGSTTSKSEPALEENGSESTQVHNENAKEKATVTVPKSKKRNSKHTPTHNNLLVNEEVNPDHVEKEPSETELANVRKSPRKLSISSKCEWSPSKDTETNSEMISPRTIETDVSTDGSDGCDIDKEKPSEMPSSVKIHDEDCGNSNQVEQSETLSTSTRRESNRKRMPSVKYSESLAGDSGRAYITKRNVELEESASKGDEISSPSRNNENLEKLNESQKKANAEKSSPSKEKKMNSKTPTTNKRKSETSFKDMDNELDPSDISHVSPSKLDSVQSEHGHKTRFQSKNILSSPSRETVDAAIASVNNSPEKNPRVRNSTNITRKSSEFKTPNGRARSASVSVKSAVMKVTKKDTKIPEKETSHDVAKESEKEEEAKGEDASPTIRRSVRPHITTQKMKSMDDQKSAASSPSQGKSTVFNPNSALAIKQRMGMSDERLSKSRRSLVRKNDKSDFSHNVSIESEKTTEECKLDDVVDSESSKTPSEKDEKAELTENRESSIEIDKDRDPSIESSSTSDQQPSETLNDMRAEGGSDAIDNNEHDKKPNKAETKLAKTKKPSTVPSPLPVRSSNRVSKPNRLYSDEFSMELLPHKVASKNEKVTPSSKKAEHKDTPASSLTPTITSGKLKIRLKLGGVDVGVVEEGPSVNDSTPVQPEKRIPAIRNGVFVNYVPSVKPVIEDIVIDGETIKLNEIVCGVMDSVLLEVCQDGVKSHSEIEKTHKRSKTTKKQKEMCERRQKMEAKKLEIQMRSTVKASSPSSSGVNSEENGKRRRYSRLKNDEYMYTPLRNKPKEDRDYDYVNEDEESRYQKARDKLSKEFNADMERAIEIADVDFAKKEKDSAKKPTRKRKSISLDEYFKDRNVSNRPECGIKLFEEPSTSGVKSDDFFYHEMLTDVPEILKKEEEICVDEEIDIGVPLDDNTELIEKQTKMLLRCHGDSITAAEQIEKLMSRPSKFDGSEYTIDDVLYRAAEQAEQKRYILSCTLSVIKRQYILETTPSTSYHNIESSLYNMTNANAQKLKNIFTMYDCPRQDSVCWVHKYLVESLPVCFLASYLALLKHAKPMTSAHIKLIVKSTNTEMYPWNEITDIVMQHVTTKPFDPEIESLNMTIPHQSLPDTVFLMVSPALSIGEFYNKPRSQETIFKWLKSIGHPESEIIRAKDDEDETSTIAEFIVDNIVDVIIEKVRMKSRDFPDLRIVLVGWGWTTYAVHRAAVLVHGVSAIISLGFPIITDAGRRGVADDDILLTYCPTFFVVGADGQYYDNIAMKDLRSSMINPTGLLVVGHASDQLLVPTSILVRLGVTQKVIFRLILEKIMEFLRLSETKWERIKLFPAELNNVMNVDGMIMKSEKAQQQQMQNPAGQAQQSSHSPSTTSSVASPIQSTARRATVSCIDDIPRATAQPPMKKKRELSSTSSQSPLSPAPGVDGARQKFQEAMLKKIQIPDDAPRRSDSVPKPVERGDLRDRVATPSSSRVPTPSPQGKGPIDPASISLV